MMFAFTSDYDMDPVLIHDIMCLMEMHRTIENRNNIYILGAGSTSILASDKKRKVWKYSFNIYDEYGLLKMVSDTHKNRQKNVIKLRGEVEDHVALAVEYIQGMNLEHLLQEKGSLSQSDALRYASGIVNGILEMRQAGLYHRDLHNRNVMIDTARDRPVIIDLGSATIDPYKICKGNRAYGGNNDLVSLGQIIYRMVMGAHPFKDDLGYTFEDRIKQKIKRRREETYASSEKLAQFLKSVQRKMRRAGQEQYMIDITLGLLDDNLWRQPKLKTVEELQAGLKKYQ